MWFITNVFIPMILLAIACGFSMWLARIVYDIMDAAHTITKLKLAALVYDSRTKAHQAAKRHAKSKDEYHAI